MYLYIIKYCCYSNKKIRSVLTKFYLVKKMYMNFPVNMRHVLIIHVQVLDTTCSDVTYNACTYKSIFEYLNKSNQ